MEQEKFKFRLVKLEQVEDKIDLDALNKHQVNSKNRSEFNGEVEVGFLINEKEEIIKVRTGITHKFKEHLIYRFAVESSYNIINLKKHLSTNDKGESTIKGSNFVYYLVDHSLSHLRAFQAYKLNGLTDNIFFIPIGGANKFMNPENEVGRQD